MANPTLPIKTRYLCEAKNLDDSAGLDCPEFKEAIHGTSVCVFHAKGDVYECTHLDAGKGGAKPTNPTLLTTAHTALWTSVYTLFVPSRHHNGACVAADKAVAALAARMPSISTQPQVELLRKALSEFREVVKTLNDSSTKDPTV